MTKIKKGLLICCIVFMMATMVIVLPSCTKSKISDDYIISQFNSQTQLIQDLANKVNTQQATIDYQKAQIEALQSSIKQGSDNINNLLTQINSFQASMQNSVNNINTQLAMLAAAVNK
jgi:peptidoglycan hydrolase CwlO-like protein